MNASQLLMLLYLYYIFSWVWDLHCVKVLQSRSFHTSPLFIQCLLRQTEACRGLSPVHNKQINQSMRAWDQNWWRKASVRIVVIGGLFISWLWEQNTVFHTVVVDSHTFLPPSSSSSFSVVMEKLPGCSRCGRAASSLPQLLYITAEWREVQN